MMIRLHGFALSNYYNMVKFALLEKGIAFDEVEARPSQEQDYKAKSPMGKVPCLETAQGFLSETSVMFDYLEAVQTAPPLLPADPFAAAKVREMSKVLELYVELPARRHYAEIFFGEKRNETAVTEAKPVIENGLHALRQLGRFAPFVGGDFSQADIVAVHTFIYAAPVCQAVYGWDILAEVPGLADAIEAANARPAGARVLADQQAALAAFQAQKG